MRFGADEKAVTTLALLVECFEVLGGVPKVVLALTGLLRRALFSVLVTWGNRRGAGCWVACAVSGVPGAGVAEPAACQSAAPLISIDARTLAVTHGSAASR